MELCPWCRQNRVMVQHEYVTDSEIITEYHCERCGKTVRVTHIPKLKNKDTLA